MFIQIRVISHRSGGDKIKLKGRLVVGRPFLLVRWWRSLLQSEGA
jgi:hypothetical protein